MSKILYSNGDLVVESVRRTGRIGARAPEYVRITTMLDEAELEPNDVEALVAALDLWLEDRRK